MGRLLIFFLPMVLASGTYEYKGFDSCGMGGWTCRNTAQGYEVIYRCNSFDRDARIWMWTARIPGSATSLAIENCDHVEIHPDCTMGYRGYTMRTFRASNIKELEILKPLAPYVFLHDNDQLPHMPPEVIFENIGKLTVFNGVFDKAGRRCRIKQQQMESFSAKNVTIHRFLENQFSEQTLQSFVLDNVKFGISDELTSLSVNGNVTITDSVFGSTTTNGTMTFKGSQVTIKNNQFEELKENALSVKCFNFEFNGNKVSLLGKGSLDILAKNVSIVGNTILKTEDVAFAHIKPGGGPTGLGYEAAKRAVYRLDGNVFQDVGILSLHPDIEAYNDTCYEFILQNNQLSCSCPEFNWSVATPPFQFFYDKFSAYENNNTCWQLTPPCNLAHALTFKTSCALLHTCDSQASTAMTAASRTTSVPVTDVMHTTNKPTTIKTVIASAPSRDSRISAPVSAQSTNTSVIFIVCATVLILALVSATVLYYFYTKRKETEVVGPVYQNQCRSDYDEQNLIDEQ